MADREATDEATGRWRDEILARAINESALAPASKASYQRALRMLDGVRHEQAARALAGGCSCSSDGLCAWLLEVDAAWGAITQKYCSINTRHMLVKSVLAAFKHALGCAGVSCDGDGETRPAHSPSCCSECGPAHGRWLAIMRELDATARSRVLSSEMSQREERAWIDFHDVQKLEARLRADPMSCGTLEHLLVAMYTLTEPVRGGDLGCVRLLHTVVDDQSVDATAGNVLIVPPQSDALCVLLLREHKTSKSHGTLRRVLCAALSGAIRASLRQQPRAMLFITPNGVPFTSEAAFTAWANRTMGRVFGRPATANTLRHSYVTALHDAGVSAAAIMETAARMGHDVATAVAYRRIRSPRRPQRVSLESGELLLGSGGQ